MFAFSGEVCVFGKRTGVTQVKADIYVNIIKAPGMCILKHSNSTDTISLFDFTGVLIKLCSVEKKDNPLSPICGYIALNKAKDRRSRAERLWYVNGDLSLFSSFDLDPGRVLFTYTTPT